MPVYTFGVGNCHPNISSASNTWALLECLRTVVNFSSARSVWIER